MVTKRILNEKRVRRIEGGFSFIPHRFITGGFLPSLGREEQDVTTASQQEKGLL